MVDRPEFGQKVTVKALAEKDHKGWITFWKKSDRWDLPREGLYIGRRNVYGGILKETPVSFYDGEIDEDPSPYYFSRQSQHEVWLIVFNEHQNPVRAFPEDVEVIND